MTSLPPVSVGDPHAAAHNAERTAINALISSGVGGGSMPFLALARNPELMMFGSITRDANGTPTAASLIWPDGTIGVYAATAVSSLYPGSVDAYYVTYGYPTEINRYTQPAVTRDASGKVSILPAIVVT